MEDRHLSAVTGGPSPFEPSPTPPGGLLARGRNKVGVLRPLAIRDFALLWSGLAISMIGDGIYFVAIAWQVYELKNAATALSVVGVAWSLPMIVFVLLGGVLSDRIERRRLLIASDVLRGLAIGTLGLLSMTGRIELWHVYTLVAFYGTGEALFGPAFGAIVPDIVPSRLLTEANSLDHFLRPFAIRLVGPALGGWVIAAFGPGQALVIDGATFFFSAAFVFFITRRPVEKKAGSLRHSALSEIKEGFAFVRSRVWLWGTIAGATLGILIFIGPFEVLIPYLVKNRLGGDASDLGLVFAAGGVGAILASIAMGQWGLPKRHMTFMYVVWTIGVFAMALFAVATSVTQAMVVSFVMWACFTAGMVVWGTLLHRLVPSELLGRVTSFDWMLSLLGMPISFALTGVVADSIGAETTLFWAGVIGGIETLAFLFLPGMRDTETDGSIHPLPEQIEEEPALA